MEIGVLRRDGRTDPFFDGAAAGRLMIKRCAGCAQWYAPDASECPACGGEEPTWAEASGHATLVSWAIAPARPRPDGSVPPAAVLALVELREGLWLHSRLDDAGHADPHDLRLSLREGLPLRAHFEHPEEGESYLVFRVPAPSGPTPGPPPGAAPGHEPTAPRKEHRP
jgi:uncharacterized OB-fold protein